MSDADAAHPASAEPSPPLASTAAVGVDGGYGEESSQRGEARDTSERGEREASPPRAAAAAGSETAATTAGEGAAASSSGQHASGAPGASGGGYSSGGPREIRGQTPAGIICLQFRDTGSCRYGLSCKYIHDPNQTRAARGGVDQRSNGPCCQSYK
jgi:hypothetical protein